MDTEFINNEGMRSDKLNWAVISHFGVFIGCCIGLGLFTILIMVSINPFLGFLVGLLLFVVMCAYFAKMIIGKLKSIETLVDGLIIALQNEIKAEHMKVDLVTNVSHDLKTPEKANEYVTILQKKSERLKHLVEDLFEVSIANSGAVTIKLEPLSLNELLGQAVGEYEDKFKEKKLDIRLNTDAKVMINGDSSRMWRVLSNLFDNVIKYSMDSTRVYIDCNQDARGQVPRTIWSEVPVPLRHLSPCVTPCVTTCATIYPLLHLTPCGVSSKMIPFAFKSSLILSESAQFLSFLAC